MTNVIVAFPKPEDAKSIRNILVKNGFPVVAVCTSGAQTLQYADDLHNGVVVCGYRLTDMIYSQLREDLSEQFDMLLLASRRFTSEVDDKRIRCVAMPLKVHELLASVDAAVEESELRKKKAFPALFLTVTATSIMDASRPLPMVLVKLASNSKCRQVRSWNKTNWE